MKDPAALLSRLLDGVVTERPLLVGDDAGELVARLATLSGPLTTAGKSPARPGAAETAGPGAARALPFEQPFRDRSFDLVVATGLTGPLPCPARTFVEMRRVSCRYVLAIVTASPPPGLPDEERLAGLLSAAGLRVRKTRQSQGLLGALAERPD